MCSSRVRAQTEEAFGDDATDPVRLFERGQSAHARGELEKAIGFYEQALKVRPEFPEAEFQRGNALASLGRLAEAEAAFRRAISYKKNWSLPYSALGALLMRQNRDKEAEQFFRQALDDRQQGRVALRMLSEITAARRRCKEALELAKRATANPEAPASAWVGLAIAEKANGNKAAAKTTLDRVLADEPENVAALIERADLFTDEKNFELAITDLKAAAKLKPDDKAVLSRLAYALQQAGKTEEALAVAKAAGLEVQQAGGQRRRRRRRNTRRDRSSKQQRSGDRSQGTRKTARKKSAQRDAARPSRRFVSHRRSGSLTRFLSQGSGDSTRRS